MRVASGPDPPGSSRCVIERRRTPVPHVYLSATLATPASSGSTDTPWLCRGRLPPIPAPPKTGCPQLHRPAATGRRRRSLTSTQSTSASRRTGGRTRVFELAVMPMTGRSPGRMRKRVSGADEGCRPLDIASVAALVLSGCRTHLACRASPASEASARITPFPPTRDPRRSDVRCHQLRDTGAPWVAPGLPTDGRAATR